MRVLGLALAPLALLAFATTAQAQATHLGNWSNGPGGNACPPSVGGTFSNCYATQTGTVAGPTTDPLASASVYNLSAENQETFSTNYTSIDGSEFDVWLVGDILNFTYTPGADDPFLHYFAIKQATEYALFYDVDPITGGQIDLGTLGFNNADWSNITFFNSPGTAVPEPGTWALMLLGFGAAGYSLRRSRRRKGDVLQFA